MSFEELLENISPVLKRIVQKVNTRFSFVDEEDLFQEASMHLWVNFRDGRLNNKTDSYILQGCFFYLKNYLRKRREKVSLISLDASINEDGSTLAEKLPSGNSELCFDYVRNKILIEEIRDSGLTKREGEVLSLCLEGLTVRGIGQKLGISHTRVIKLRNNIRRKSHKRNTMTRAKFTL
ncbi:MAG: sigma-70 family RNA polymerase sigma factor [Candidatus Omnitrophica bacterium]|nr:sigma-70 family RNA polymerase sigma factor [Candidatus Omnitrophota bacterium]